MPKAAGLNVDEEGPGQIEVTLSKPNVKMVVNALGPPPQYIVEQCHDAGILVGGLVGSRQHAERQVQSGTDVLVAQGTEAGGHCGEISTMVLVPQVVDAVGSDVPVLAAGGIRRRPPDGRGDGARRAGRVDRIDVVAHHRGRHVPGGHREPPRRAVTRRDPLARDDRKTGAPVAHEVDRGMGSTGCARHAADAVAGSPLQRGVAPHRRVHNKEFGGYPVGQVIGSIDHVRPSKDLVLEMVEQWIDTVGGLNELMSE